MDHQAASQQHYSFIGFFPSRSVFLFFCFFSPRPTPSDRLSVSTIIGSIHQSGLASSLCVPEVWSLPDREPSPGQPLGEMKDVYASIMMHCMVWLSPVRWAPSSVHASLLSLSSRLYCLFFHIAMYEERNGNGRLLKLRREQYACILPAGLLLLVRADCRQIEKRQQGLDLSHVHSRVQHCRSVYWYLIYLL